MGSIFSPKASPQGPDPSLMAQLAEKESELAEQKKQQDSVEEQRKQQLRGKRSLLSGGYAGFTEETKGTIG